MASHKRKAGDHHLSQHKPTKRRLSSAEAQPHHSNCMKGTTSGSIQIVTGSYDRVLHGIIATLPEQSSEGDMQPGSVIFNDNFIFNAHASAIRCLALSPPSNPKGGLEEQKVILASGGTDEKINLYHLSTSLPPSLHSKALLSSKPSSKLKLENPRNKELGALMHHSSNINVLQFPTRRMLLSGAEDNTIAISRTSDWTVLSTIKAPIPRISGRPSGDTAPPGETPTGINDFAIHPSLKTMISVGKGEKCMRLWNLVTGKKAGVLNFERHLLQAVREGKFSSGEGRKVIWNGEGDAFVVGFDRGAAAFGMDCKARGSIVATPISKLHQMQFITLPESGEERFVASTEDGRLLFYVLDEVRQRTDATDDLSESVPLYKVLAELGGKAAGQHGRIKDFEILRLSQDSSTFTVVTASSDGSIKLWALEEKSLARTAAEDDSVVSNTLTSKKGMKAIIASDQPVPDVEIKQVGRLLGSYSTPDRITCLKAFALLELNEESATKDEVDGDTSGSEFEGLGSQSD